MRDPNKAVLWRGAKDFLSTRPIFTRANQDLSCVLSLPSQTERGVSTGPDQNAAPSFTREEARG